MCGLAGILSTQNPTDIQLSMERMLELIIHRGPDGTGIEVFKVNHEQSLAFGHQRLAIIDITDAGLMPMSSADNDLSIIFNGEIFNYLELKKELIQLGHRFLTQTDTEVLLNAYIEWGSNCLNKLNGMFSFAIYSKSSNALFLARDRFGVKPLYYFQHKGTFIFASEIKSILSHEIVQTQPNIKILGKFLYTGLINDVNETLFKDICSLQPGHFIEIHDGNVSINKWYFGALHDPNTVSSKKDFKDLFYDAVKLRLRSDVEVGACLSGGTDSSAIVGAVAEQLRRSTKLSTGSFKTFSAVFSDPKISETKYVNQVTDFTQTNNISFSPKNELFWESIDKLIWHNDEPIQTPSQFIQWSVFEQAQKVGVKVTLDGQGVDELAAGYPAHYSVFLAELIRGFKFKTFFKNLIEICRRDGEGRNPLSLLLRVIYLLLPNKVILLLSKQRLFRNFIKGSSLLSITKKEYKNKWFDIALKEQIIQKNESTSLVRRMKYDFFHASLPALLRYEDRCSMAFSIEARTPFLDYRLVELVQNLSPTQLISNGLSKAFIRDGVKEFIPEEIFNRSDKKGYPMPSSEWIKESQERIRALFTKSSFISQFFDHEMLQNFLLAESIILTNDEVWRLVFTEIWFKEFFELDQESKEIKKHTRFNSEHLGFNEAS